MADPYEVQLVATDREVWSGQATLVSFETHDGEVGVMPGHSPMLAMLKDGPILIRQPEGGDLHAAVHTGFAVVDAGKVIILAESAELAEEIDVKQAEDLLAEAQASDEGPGKIAAIARAETRLKVVKR
ncbi:MAG TPA: F0F1 ATP synthase subunit epsilon [Actinobacteria bacterium]|jgi:F-type H+-transporting ATPase subunit epsilon|nr:F0F1 ATP synthase subunit epsilon [Actinomycetota bacterium]